MIECTTPRVGRYVFVRLMRTDELTLCEVEVYGDVLSSKLGYYLFPNEIQSDKFGL